MANFIVYGTRVGNRKVPTLHVLGTYASGGFDLINANGGGVYSPSMAGYDTTLGISDVTGLTGNIGPDLITGTSYPDDATALFTPDGNFEVVGVQVTRLGTIRRTGLQANTFDGQALVNYIEKTEHRYLQNGHIMIKVYFDEDTVNLGNTLDSLFVSGCVLLQAGSASFQVEGPKKRKVPFALTLPFLPKGAEAGSVQNPTIDVNSFIYGSGEDNNFGTEVSVLDMGNVSNGLPDGISFNTVRTQAWSYGQYGSVAEGDEILPADDTRFYPHFNDVLLTGFASLKLDAKNFRIDTARSVADLYTEGSDEKFGSTGLEGYVGNRYYGNIGLHTSSSFSFDLRELHQMSVSAAIPTLSGYKTPWGRLKGCMAAGPGQRYSRDGSPSIFPFVGAGNAVGGVRLYRQHSEGQGLPHLGPGSMSPGGKSHFYEDGKCRNPYYPERHTAFSHYISFYEIKGHGSSFGQSAYLPDDITELPLTDASQYPFYVADSFRQSMIATQAINADQIAATTWDGTDWWAPVGANGVSPITAVAQGAMSWQDYISCAVHATSNPYSVSNTALIQSLTSNASDGSKLVDQFDIRFSGAVPTNQTANNLYSSMLNTGIGFGIEADLEDIGVDTSAIVGSYDDSIENGSIFMYRVFMYSDHPQPRISPLLQDPMAYDLTNTDVFTGDNAYTHGTSTPEYDVEYVQTLKNSDGTIVASNLIVNWDSQDITYSCVDRNSSDNTVQLYIHTTDINLLANDNTCGIDSYTRCGCENAVEEFGLGELKGFSTFSGDRNRFESIITYPRPVTTNQVSTISATSAFPSILYINSYYAPIDTSTAIDATFASDYLESSTPSNFTFDTSAGATHTHSFSDLGISDYGTLPFLNEFNDNSTDTNTFTYLYMPGREPFEEEGENANFPHDDAAEAQVFMTVQGAGSNESGGANDVPHRQMLLFQAPTLDVAGTSFKRAHSDLSFTQNWENENVEASYISLGTNADCDTNNDDNPQRRIRKFVTVTGASRDSGAEGGEGDGGHGDGGDGKTGCTDPMAINYDPTATVDDGSCVNCDTEAEEGATAVAENADPFFYIPFAFYDSVIGNLQGRLQGPLNRTTSAASGVSIGSAIELPFQSGQPGSLTYEWWAGNAFNCFNTRGPNEAQTLGALNTPSTVPTDYTASPYNNTANSKYSYFRAKAGNPSTLADIALNGTAWQFGSDQSTNTALQEAVQSMLSQIGGEAKSNIQARIYRYSDWETYVATKDNAVIQNETSGNNGWYLDDYGAGTFPSGAQPNVYVDTLGDYSALNLHTATAIHTLFNQATGAGGWGFKFDFRNYNTFENEPTDIGLEAGEQYVIVWRLYPKNSCTGDRKYYYWAANFWVKYCECTRPDSNNVGAANPSNADPAPTVPHTLYSWNGTSLFPGANSPNDQVSAGLAIPGVNTPANYCAIVNNEDSPGLSNARLCADRQPDATIDCAGFASWCLSDIRPTCNYTEDLVPFGSVTFDVLVDGFFTQSDVDTWGLQPFGAPYQNASNTVDFLWQISVTLQGDSSTVEPVMSHIYDAATNTWSLNPAVSTEQYVPDGNGTFYGNLASITFADLEWDDADVNAVGMQLQMVVSLEYLGMVDTTPGQGNDGVPIYNYPEYVVAADGTTSVDSCTIYEIPYTADFSDCVEQVAGCVDPLANNYNENATISDGSCEYTDCTELYDSFRNAIFITDVTTTNDNLLCEAITVDEVEVSQYTPQYEGTMKITVQDFSLGVLGIGGTASNFVIGIVRMQGGAVNSLGPLLQTYDDNAAQIQALAPGTAFTVPGQNACFVMPTDNADDVTEVLSVAGQVDPVGTQGIQTVTTVPEFAIFNALVDDVQAGGLIAGQYLVFVIPHINLDLYEDDAAGIADCTDQFLSFTDEMTFAGIDNTIEDVDCPEPCNQFTNPEDCPNSVPGCTDPAADNYNEDATFDDGSCEYCTDCDPCDLYPLDPECTDCDKAEEAPLIAGFKLGMGARLRECDGETDECCPDQDACNYSQDCENSTFANCEYDCTDGGEECDETVEDCDPEPPCPDPANPECDGEPTGSCVDEGDCPCVDELCNQDCIFEGNCPEEDDGGGGGGPTDTFSTTTVICIPDVSIPIPDITINGQAPLDIAEAAAICDTTKGDVMLMKMKSGVEYDTTDLLKLSLINYIFTTAAKQQLDCIFDCQNYETRAKSGGKARGFTTDLRGAVNCEARWKAGKKQFFAGSSTFKKNTTVKYMRIQNGRLVASYYTAKRDWMPGMDVPNSTSNRELRTWEPCVNLKYQEGTNPENYWQTFWEFITRFCSSCEVITQDDDIEPQKTSKGTRTFGTSFSDEFGNEIIF